MSNFARRDPPLDRVFPSSQAPGQGPNELTENVQLVHPWPGRGHRLDQQVYKSYTSAAALTPQLDTPAVPLGDYWEIMSLNLFHSSGDDQTLYLSIVDPTSNLLIVGRADAQGGGLIPIQCTDSVARGIMTPTPLFVPGLWHIRVVGSLGLAVYTVGVRGIFLEHRLAEEPLY